MNKVKFLAALAIPALFAACSQEEFTEAANQKVDLSNRQVLENVVLNFGDDAMTRAGIGTTAYNSYAWTEEDGVGACIIDAPEGGNYVIKDYISSNYKYYFTADNQWKTDALMVEGNYMFYAPYSEKHLVRSNITAVLPTTQNVLTKDMDNNPIKEFYESGNTVFFGYKFLSAKDQSNVINVPMRHIFAYPLFTLTNLYDTRKDKSKGEPEYKDINIVKVVLQPKGGDKFGAAFVAENTKVANGLKQGEGNALVWDATKHEDNVTADLLKVAQDNQGRNIEAKEIVINFGKGITLKGEESLSFHAVLPAAKYANGLNAVAYDAEGNSYSVSAKAARTGLTLNPGYRYPAQEYNTDGTLKASKGQLLTYKLEEKNAAPTDILDNADFIAYLNSLSVRYNDLTQVANKEAVENESQFVLNENAEIIINSEMIDALDNFNYVDGRLGTVTFTKENIAIAGDVTVLSADFNTDKVTMVVASENGKKYKVIMPAATAMAATAGTYVISSGSLTIDENQAAPTNIIVTGTVGFDGTNAKKINSLSVVGSGNLTLIAKTEGVRINVGEGATLTVNEDILVNTEVVNNGTIANSGILFAETNVNNGTINAVTATSVTKVAAGKGTIVNNNLAKVKANAEQTVKYQGIYDKFANTTSGLAKKGSADYGINFVTITGADLNADFDILMAPIKGCKVSTIVLSEATAFTVAKGGSMAGLTLVFDQTCAWTGDNFKTPDFTNATIRVADGKTVTVNYANVSGKQDKSVTGYKTGKIKAGDAGKVNF